MSEWNPKTYFYRRRFLTWKKDLTKRQIKALRKGEIFVLLDAEGFPHAVILMDSYNQIRERAINLLAIKPRKEDEGG
jgi:hypothetical protein